MYARPEVSVGIGPSHGVRTDREPREVPNHAYGITSNFPYLLCCCCGYAETTSLLLSRNGPESGDTYSTIPTLGTWLLVITITVGHTLLLYRVYMQCTVLYMINIVISTSNKHGTCTWIIMGNYANPGFRVVWLCIVAAPGARTVEKGSPLTGPLRPKTG